eukprot:1333165-Pyramimonas_sp.AAC.1
MWLSPWRCAQQFARASRIEGGSFSKCGSRLSAAHICTFIRGVEVPRKADRQKAAVRLIRGVGIPRTMFWHAS